MADPVQLHPNEQPHAIRLLEELTDVVEKHLQRGEVSFVEVIGSLEAVKYQVIMSVGDID